MFDFWDNLLTDRDRTVIKYILAVMGTILIGMGIYHVLTYRRTVNAEVIDMGWELKIQRQQYTTVQESDWYIPAGGRERYHQSEIRTYERYKSGWHYETKSGGTYDCGTKKNPKTCRRPDIKVKVDEYSSRPVYDTKYYYDIDRWIDITPLRTEGKDKEDVHWPDTSDGIYNDYPSIGNIRLGVKWSHYWLSIKSEENKTYSVDLSENNWRGYYKGKWAKLTLNIIGSVVKVE